MTIYDEQGLAYSGADPSSLETFSLAQLQFQCYIDDPLATTDQALSNSPEFVMAHVLRAYLHLLGTEPADIAVAKASLELGEIDEVLALNDGPIFGQRSTVVLDMVDSSAMLWRLYLRGVDVD